MAPPVVGARIAAPGDPRIEEIMQVLEAMRDVMAQQTLNQVAAAAPVAAPIIAPTEVQAENIVARRERPIHKLVEQFLRLNPPQFTGSGDPEAAALWIQKLEKTFSLLMCNETEKVILATYQLEGVANTWWRTTQGAVFPEGVVLEWNAFLEAFNDKYFSETAWEMKMAEFQRLLQGSMAVDQCEVKFAQLSQYAPELIENSAN
ncbi:uncharacterized protein LOC104440422 [Eucalyptus grandis]|uniref:uncharacterized protein LOC104440422 n=1 Tax=Eucalyptus grandis TaxID=71139 RepID=UPI00192F0476|nr:uncharacterized protein LOC104440422 [Eucalyptus grandis]